MPESCLDIAERLETISDFFSDSGLASEVDTRSSSSSPSPAAVLELKDALVNDSLVEDQEMPSSWSRFIRNQPIESTNQSQGHGDVEVEKPPDVDLSEQKINEIFDRSCSIVNFATNLMLHFFSEAELCACSNVYGRYVRQDSSQKSASALDAKRIETIRQLVEHKAGSTDIWKSCVVTMNIKIWTVKDRYKNER